MKRPTFFLSSTIFDFRDLRSALKFHLERQGCTVLASEFNDFAKPLDKHSYEACLASIGAADYFILLIGGRVGGWYDNTQQISITQREYREAYRLRKSGKPRIIAFVRDEIWMLRNEYKKQARLVDETVVDPVLAATLKSGLFKSMDDAKFVIGFIDEVSRNEETKGAVGGNGELPTNNWIHVFRDFADVASVLTNTVFAGLPFEEAAIKALLRAEMRTILKASAYKMAGRVSSPMPHVRSLHETHGFQLEDVHDSYTDILREDWVVLGSLAVHASRLLFNISTTQQALLGRELLQFDVADGSITESPLYRALSTLKTEASSLNRSNEGGIVKDFLHLAITLKGQSSYHIDTIKLLPLLHILDRWANVHELALAIARHLAGGALVIPELRPQSPSRNMNRQIEAESVTDEEIDCLLAGS